MFSSDERSFIDGFSREVLALKPGPCFELLSLAKIPPISLETLVSLRAYERLSSLGPNELPPNLDLLTLPWPDLHTLKMRSFQLRQSFSQNNLIDSV
jgi:hypothetical protein